MTSRGFHSLKAIAEREHLRFLEQLRIEDPEAWLINCVIKQDLRIFP